MATKAAPLSALASDSESADRAQQALDRLLASLDARKKPAFDPTLLALAEGFLAPTQTGGFGESLGMAAGKLRSAQEKRIQQEQEDAKARFEVEQRRADLARQRKLMEGYAGIQAPPGASTGAPAGAPGGQGRPQGVQLFPGPGLPDFKQFMQSRQAEGIPYARALEEYRKLQQDALKITEGGAFNTLTGEYFPVPSADVVNIQIYGYEGTYSVPKRVAIQLNQLASQNNWDEYGALAKRVVEGPGAAPTKPPEDRPLPVTPGPIGDWYVGGAQPTPRAPVEGAPAGPQEVTSTKPEVQAILERLQREPRVVTPPPAPAMTSPVSPQGEAPQGPLPPMPARPQPITLPPGIPPRPPQAVAPALGADQRPAEPPRPVPVEPARPQQAGAPRLQSVEEMAARTKEAEARASTLGTESAKREAAMPEKEDSARRMNFAASQVIDLTKTSPNAFGIFARPGLLSSVGGLINEGIRAGTTNIALGDFQAAVTKAMPGIKQQDLDNLTRAAGLLAEIELIYTQLYLKGQGQITEGEREIVRRLGGNVSQSATVLQQKAKLLEMRSKFDLDYADAYRTWKENNPRASIMEFERSRAVQDMKKNFDQSLRNAFNVARPQAPTASQQARPPAGPSSTRREADALVGR